MQNQKTKIAAATVILGLTIFASGIASADTEFTIDVTVDEVTIFSTCESVDFPLEFSINQGQVTPACTVEAASNAVDGFSINIHGTEFENTTYPGMDIFWDKLATNTADMNMNCAPNCTEAWGFRISFTEGVYDRVRRGNANKEFNATNCNPPPCWHTVPEAPTEILSHSNDPETSGIVDKNASFDIYFGAVTGGGTAAGNYETTVTLTLSTN